MKLDMLQLMQYFSCISFVRHGHEEMGIAGLSGFGKMQLDYLKRHMKSVLQKEGIEAGSPGIFISCSYEKRAIDSVDALRKSDDVLIVMEEMYLQNKDKILERDTKQMFRNVLEIAFSHKLGSVVVVAHGDMPAVLAEEAASCIYSGRGAVFGSVGNGEGFCIIPSVRKIFEITVGGPAEL